MVATCWYLIYFSVSLCPSIWRYLFLSLCAISTYLLIEDHHVSKSVDVTPLSAYGVATSIYVYAVSQDQIQARPRPSVTNVTTWLKQLAAALAYMHGGGPGEVMLHRDIKGAALESLLTAAATAVATIACCYCCCCYCLCGCYCYCCLLLLLLLPLLPASAVAHRHC